MAGEDIPGRETRTFTVPNLTDLEKLRLGASGRDAVGMVVTLLVATGILFEVGLGALGGGGTGCATISCRSCAHCPIAGSVVDGKSLVKHQSMSVRCTYG
jgi:hypothetical protein